VLRAASPRQLVEVRHAPGLVARWMPKISAEPRKPLEPRSLYVIFLVPKDIRVNDGDRIQI
jgi:hypothetical protein